MKISAGEIRVGMLLEYKNDLWQVLKTQHVKPGKGGAFAQVEMKSVNKNTKLNERFRSSETVEKASLEEITFNYLYNDEINYLGKSVIQKQKEKGVTRSLVGLKLQINEISLTKTLPVFYKDELIGDLRSACFSPQFQCCLGIAMINVSHHNFSEPLNLSINGQEITTEITSIPFTK